MKKFDKEIIASFSNLKNNRLLAIIFIIFRTVVSLYTIYLVQKLIDTVIKGNYDDSLLQFKKLVIVLIFYTVSLFLAQFYLRKLFFLGDFTIIKFLYDKVLNRNISNFSSAEIFSKITNDSTKISTWFSQGITLLITQIFILITTLILLINYDLIISLIVIVIISLSFLLIKLVGKKISKLIKDDQILTASVNEQILQSFSGIDDIKQLAKENYFSKLLSKNLFDHKKPLNNKIAFYYSLYIGLSASIAFILPLIAAVIAIYFTLIGKLTLGSIMAIYSLVKFLDEPIRVISDQINSREIALEMQERVRNLYQYKKETKKQTLPTLRRLTINIKSLKLQNKVLFENINFTINKGDIVLLKGQSGRGKTTFVNFLVNNNSQCFLDGEVLWNDISIEQTNKLGKILKVAQEPFIFKGTILENIIIDDENLKADIDEIIEVCCLQNFIKDKSLFSYLNENGSNISGGQKQRIALARMLIRKPELLILDEVTSALDPKISIEVVNNLKLYAEKNNITIIAISHKNDFDKVANQTITL